MSVFELNMAANSTAMTMPPWHTIFAWGLAIAGPFYHSFGTDLIKGLLAKFIKKEVSAMFGFDQVKAGFTAVIGNLTGAGHTAETAVAAAAPVISALSPLISGESPALARALSDQQLVADTLNLAAQNVALAEQDVALGRRWEAAMAPPAAG